MTLLFIWFWGALFTFGFSGNHNNGLNLFFDLVAYFVYWPLILGKILNDRS